MPLVQRLTTKLGRAPTDAELAEAREAKRVKREHKGHGAIRFDDLIQMPR